MTKLTEELYESRFHQAVGAVENLAPNRVVPLRWALWVVVRDWPVAPSVERIRKEAQLMVNSEPSVWQSSDSDYPKSRRHLSGLEKTKQAEEAAVRARLPKLRKGTMDGMTRARVVYYLGQDVYDRLPD